MIKEIAGDRVVRYTFDNIG